MRELILMRHGEAAPLVKAGTDFTRPLTAPGSAAAAVAALQIAQRHGAPDYLLCSPAVRTTDTAAALRTALRLDAVPLHSDARIYLASPGQLLQVIAECPDAARRVLLIAHNPAVSQLAATLQPGSGRARPLATAEFRHFVLPVAHWQELREPT